MKIFALWLLAGILVATTQAAPRPAAASSPTFHWPWMKPAPTPIPLAPSAAPLRAKPTPPPRPTPVPTPMVALPAYDEITSTRLQIFLDNHNFGPGKIDGEMGEFFRKALLSYKRANGMPTTGAVDA
ncbi:MAG: peptidoglycan-binding protein, partial [Verrucomicrobiota bacterium]|nr:peptidoglycan-binding protein [Verrucomicrobiota bacterium]